MMLCCLLAGPVNIQAETVTSVSTSRTLSGNDELHITSTTPITGDAVINITSTDAYLFFDKVKPSVVLANYKNAIQINGEVINPTAGDASNCRLVVYKEGAAVVPHSPAYQPLESFTELNFGGQSQKYTVDQYYTNAPVSDIPQNRRAALANDNSIRSIKLKRGYMATLANEPNGMGYSRIFIADAEDININLPYELDGKISFIRVFPWEWVSKKGWCGGTWNEPALFEKNLAHGDTQSDLINATWYYHWGATVGGSANATINTMVNEEFVPEKWGKGGGVSAFYSNKRWSHLLGANEPDHSEQSNMTVEEAIEEWPILMKTGARLGSPATTDYSWLYRFMTEAAARNYRVDYVVVHAYWGGKSPANWYNDLKKVHETTGRPIWIKEWNNGANWTTEGGWDGRGYNEHNANKQLNDLKGILQVLDTASFIERYSIYNWVEDCRQIITKNGDLTKAGEYYASTTPGFAFNRAKEVIPVWNIQTAKLSYSYSASEGKLRLLWTDENGELTSKYIIEQSFDRQNWEVIGEVTSPYIHEYLTDVFTADELPNGEVHYRLKTVDAGGNIKVSNIVKYDILANKANTLLTATNLKVKEDWSVSLFENELPNDITFALGTVSYRNRTPLTARARNINSSSVELQLRTWDYLLDITFQNPDTLGFLAIPRGVHQFGGIKVLADTLHDVSKAWRTVTFATPFDVVPVVIATQITANDPIASAARIRNVTKTGFDISRKYEQGKTNVFEDISYIAATPGTGVYDGDKQIEAGINDGVSGVAYNKAATIHFENTYAEPVFFGFMQTCNDETAATLRLKTKTANKVEIFKDKERSTNQTEPKAEKIGYIVLGNTIATTAIRPVEMTAYAQIIYETATNRIYLSGHAPMNTAEVYSLLGAKVASAKVCYELSVKHLHQGVYIAMVNGQTQKIVVK
ncbi:hypothetical protein AGMMS50262_09580 [Bacteroidia bacterium]|nr:hypothetical protein AGMMS50262_09580 [Bacteroidia bacterium]